MGFLTRRDKAIPVQARRADVGPAVPSPVVIEVPNGAAVPPPPPGPTHVTHNTVYVVAPPHAAAAQPAPPQQVHHHHHHHTTQVILPRRRRLSKGSSFIGTLGFVLGGLACGTAFLPPVDRFAPWIGEVAFVLATLGWLGAVLFRRVGTTMPFVGMVVSAAGYGLGIYHTGQGQATYDWLRAKSPVALPAIKIPAPTTEMPVPPAISKPPAPAQAPTTAQPSTPAKPAAPAKPHQPTIFDADQPGWQKSSTAK